MKDFNWKGVLPHLGAVLIFLLLTLIYFSPVLDGKDIKQDDAIGSMGWGKDARDYHEKTGEYSYWSNSMFSGMPCNYTFSPQATNTFEPIGNVFTLHSFGASRRHVGCIFATFVGCYILFLALGCRPWLSVIGSVAYTFCSYNFIIIGAGHMNKSLVIATMAPLIGGILLCYKRKLLLGALVTIIFAGMNIYWSHQQMSYYTLIIAAIIAIVYFVYAYREKWLPYYWKATGVLAVSAVLSVAPAVGILMPTADYAKASMRGGSDLKDEGGGLDVDYAFQWSYGVEETLNLFVPNMYGAASNYDLGTDSEYYKVLYKEAYGYTVRMIAAKNGVSEEAARQEIENQPQLKRQLRKWAADYARAYTQIAPAYWGRQSMTSGPVYMGAIVCFLFVLGIFIVKGPEKWWLLAATVFSLVLAWGYNLAPINNFLFDYMPMYNKFRAPSQALVITTLTMSVLAVLAVKRFLEMCSANEIKFLKRDDEGKALGKAVLYSMGITGGIALLVALLGGVIFSFTTETDTEVYFRDLSMYLVDIPGLHSALIESRREMLASDAWRSLMFVLLAGGLMMAYLRFRQMKKWIFFAALFALLLIDMWPVCKRFLNDGMFMPKKQTTLIKKTDADRYIHEIEGKNKYRVLDLTRGNIFNQANTSYYHNSIGGYSPAKLARYQDVIDSYLIEDYNNIVGYLNEEPYKNWNVVSMLNVMKTGVVSMLNAKYFIAGTRAEDVMVNPEAYGHCWFVNNIKWVNNAKEEMAALDNVCKDTAIVDKAWMEKLENPEQYNNDAYGEIELTDYPNPGNIKYKSKSDAPKLAVFSDIYYKTWKAYIDGKEVTPIRVNYVLRALPIPEGEHTIEFKCVDELMETSHAWSFWMSIVVWIVLAGLVGLIIYRKVKGKE